MPKAEVLVARESFAAEVDGETVIVHAGTTRVRADHPLVKGREELFEKLDVTVPDIEQATKAPGEKRGAASAAGKTSRSSADKTAGK